VAASGAVQGQGRLYQRPDYQVEAEEDQVDRLEGGTRVCGRAMQWTLAN
jgi:hypothetical protein